MSISYGSVAMQLRCGGIFDNYFLQIVRKLCQEKNFENRLIFGEDMDTEKLGSL